MGASQLMARFARHLIGRVGRHQMAAWAVLMAAWLVLSDKREPLYVAVGVIGTLVLATELRPRDNLTRLQPWAFVAYVPWLIGQIVISNLRVARLVLDPRLPIRPSFITEAPGVAGTRALTLLGLSVTLTPGTLAVDVGGDEVFIHALEPDSASDIRDYVIARRVAQVFRETSS